MIFVAQSHYSLLLSGLQHRYKRPFQSHIRRFDVTAGLMESYVKVTSRRTGQKRPRKTQRLNLICVVSPYCINECNGLTPFRTAPKTWGALAVAWCFLVRTAILTARNPLAIVPPLC